MRPTKRSRPWRTAEVAREVGVHPNTVRLYEAWGFLPPIPRSPGGYRLFSQHHVELMRLARLALHHPYPGGKAPVLGVVSSAVAGDLNLAMEHARAFLVQVRAERSQAEAAVELLRRWAEGRDAGTASRPLRIGGVGRLLGITGDALRNWERNGLIEVPRDAGNGYRQYGPTQIDRLRVIRVLRSAGYSMMAILRMMRHLDEGGERDVRDLLDTPGPDEDALYWTDRWLTTLAEQERRATDVIEQLERMSPGSTLH